MIGKMTFPSPPPAQLRRFSRAEYDRLVDLGLFAGEHIELMRGLLVKMSPIGSRHATGVQRLVRALVLELGDRAWVRPQSPFAAAADSEPEPDAAVVPACDFSAQHPAEAFLIVEVADSSLAADRGDKARLYAEAGVTEYWIVNLVDDVVEVFCEPRPDGSWARARTVARGESLALVAFPDVVLAVAAILPS